MTISTSFDTSSYIFECCCGERFNNVGAASVCKKCRNYSVWGYTKYVINTETDEVVHGELPTDEEYAAAEAAAVIYLDPNADLDHGTSHYRTNSKYNSDENYPYGKDIYDKVLGSEQSRDKEDLRLYSESMQYHNSRFDRTLEVNNVYNRVIAYDGSQWHGQTSFHMDNDDDFRLTMVAFVLSISHPGTKRFSLKSRYI